MKIKTFYSSIGTFYDDLDDRVNDWLAEYRPAHVENILEIRYSISDKYKSVCIIYREKKV